MIKKKAMLKLLQSHIWILESGILYARCPCCGKDWQYEACSAVVGDWIECVCGRTFMLGVKND